ncbi:MAG: serine hydrolase domain-containing protein, partial [Phycisphaerales bacterium JB040]
MPQPHTDRRLLPSTANALRWAATLLAVLFATGQPGCAAGPSERETAEVARRAGQRAVSEGGVVGLSIGIARDGRLIYAEGFGHADLERTRPVTSETNFDIASVGKQFTAVAILRLAEMGNLSLSDRLRDYVPEAPAHVPNATIAEWLHHTSGFVGGELDEFNPPEWYQRPVESKELLRDVALQTGQTVFRPSEVFNYCNPGYVMLGLVVEAASGRSYERFVREELFAPAGLRSATVYRRAEPEQMADSINRGEDGYKLMPLIDFSAYAGQGSVTAGVLDLIRWELALQDGRVIDARSFEYFRTPAVVRGTHETGFMPYGAGQKLGDFHGHAKVGHTGTYDGGSAVL